MLQDIHYRRCILAPKKGSHYHKPKISKEWLIDHYVSQELSMRACADLISCSPTTILKAIKRHGIEPRACTEKAHRRARELIKQGEWPLLRANNMGENNPAKRPEVREKIRQSKIGSNNAMYGRHGPESGNWRGGISFEPYCIKFNKEFKERVRNKFGRKCFSCDEPENGRKLSVHHIDYNKNSICNGKEWAFIPLCTKHHAETNSNRWHWFNLYIHYWAMNPDINFNLQFWKI